jgi:pimeloyl-ACP methyl ester carboxylesterase
LFAKSGLLFLRRAIEQLQRITAPTWIVDADHDEAIKRQDTLFIADNIPNAGLLLQPLVSHFSFLQDPEQFNEDILLFLRQQGQQRRQ